MTDETKKENGNGKGISTEETRVLTCQCGSTAYDVTGRTKTQVTLTCAKCGLKCSVKGNVATVRVRQQEIEYAVQNTVVSPEPNLENSSGKNAEPSGEKVGDGTGGDGHPKKKLYKFSVFEDQRPTVDRAMQAVRVKNCSDDRFREQTWQGHALEYICADFLSGCEHQVLQIVDAMDAAQEDAERLAEADGKKKPTPKKIRELRSKVRDKLARESGILPEDFFESDDDRQLDLEPQQYQCPECQGLVEKDATHCANCGIEFGTPEDEETEDDTDGAEPEETAEETTEEEVEIEHDDPAEEQPAEEPTEEKEATVADSGRLKRAVLRSLEEYFQDATDAEVEEHLLPEYEVQDGAIPGEDLIQKWSLGGGYLVRVDGDKRTVDDQGNPVAVCVWIKAEPPGELVLDFSLDYDDETDEILGDGTLSTTELLPPDYSEQDPWAQPHFVDGREML